METAAVPGVTMAPRLSSLANSTPPPPLTPKRGRPTVEKKESAPKPRPVTKEQAKYAVDGMRKTASAQPEELAKVISQCMGYQRHFPKLDYSSMPKDQSLGSWQAFLKDLQNQNAEEGSVGTLQHVYLIMLEFGVRGNALVGNPLGMNIRTLPSIAKEAIQHNHFLEKEFQELAILHPEWCRPGPFQRICLATLNLLREVHYAETTGAVMTHPNDSLNTKTKQDYSDL